MFSSYFLIAALYNTSDPTEEFVGLKKSDDLLVGVEALGAEVAFRVAFVPAAQRLSAGVIPTFEAIARVRNYGKNLVEVTVDHIDNAGPGL